MATETEQEGPKQYKYQPIYVKPETHERLKALAEHLHRTIGKQAEFLVDTAFYGSGLGGTADSPATASKPGK
jgi:hypothetical protein